MANINIFYSWQSDLPKSETKSFIQRCIDDAVKTLKDTACVKANRDTLGNFGSPDITNVILDKINECDIFIADISIINLEHYVLNENGEYVKIQKYSPNPNVLLELGYAAGIIGWENIICIANEDYGNSECMPFDLEHRRIKFYSLSKQDKADVRKEIRNIIAATVMNVAENGIRPKNGMAAYKLGSYVEGRIVSDIVVYDPLENDYLNNKYTEWTKEIENLVNEISEIKLSTEKEEIIECSDTGFKLIIPKIKGISEESKKIYDGILNETIGFVTDSDFWNLGNLKEMGSIFNEAPRYLGTDEERKKHDLIEKLKDLLLKIKMNKMYWDTFKQYIIVPLALDNISSVTDKSISLYLKIENDSADIVNVDRNIIPSNFKGFEGMIYEGIDFKKVLVMPSDANICYDDDISYSINDDAAIMAQYIKKSSFMGMNNTSQYDASDYEREIKKYFVQSMENDNNTCQFYIRSLQPSEKVWIGPSLLLKPLKEEILISYTLRSDKTDGSVSGKLAIKVDSQKYFLNE